MAWVVDSVDSNIEHPEGVEIITRAFKRGHNLFGPEAVLGIARLLKEQADQHGRVGKIDSDCLLVDPTFLEQGDIAGMAHEHTMGAAYGLAYAFSSKAAGRALMMLERAVALGSVPKAEDVCITSSAQSADLVDARLKTGSFWESLHDGKMADPTRHKAIHCGYPPVCPREGPGCELEMIRLGDALGLWRR